MDQEEGEVGVDRPLQVILTNMMIGVMPIQHYPFHHLCIEQKLTESHVVGSSKEE